MDAQALLFAVDDPSVLTRIRFALMRKNITVRQIPSQSYHQTMGYLAGIPGTPAAKGTYTGAPLPEPMLVFCMPATKLDEALEALDHAGVPPMCKALLTPANSKWTPPALLAELRRERAAFARM